MKPKPKLDLNKLTDAQKASLAIKVGESLTEHESTFPDQPVSGSDLFDAGQALRGSIVTLDAERATVREMVSAQNENIRALEAMLRQTASYVAQVCAGDRAKILLSGLDVRRPGQSLGLPATPAGLTLIPCTNAGRLDLKWTPVKGAVTYTIQHATSDTLPTQWPGCLTTTKAKATITGLASCARHWFRVAALGRAGLSNWTEALSLIAQ